MFVTKPKIIGTTTDCVKIATMDCLEVDNN